LLDEGFDKLKDSFHYNDLNSLRPLSGQKFNYLFISFLVTTKKMISSQNGKNKINLGTNCVLLLCKIAENTW
jgi:hypothetical protein